MNVDKDIFLGKKIFSIKKILKEKKEIHLNLLLKCHHILKLIIY